MIYSILVSLIASIPRDISSLQTMLNHFGELVGAPHVVVQLLVMFLDR